jgi:lysophospholipase L1-like esterase
MTGGTLIPGRPFTLVTFGDSILDCAGYNPHGVHPAALLLKNDDRLFPEFKGRDLSSLGLNHLEHRAVDGARVPNLFDQLRRQSVTGPAIALLTIGGNDLLAGLAMDPGPGIEVFGQTLLKFVIALPIRPLFLGNVYDPTLGDDSRNFLGVNPALARRNFGLVNEAIARVAAVHGHLVDLHAHFLTGDLSWFTMIIEPSLRGASEVRRCFLDAIEKAGLGSDRQSS